MKSIFLVEPLPIALNIEAFYLSKCRIAKKIQSDGTKTKKINPLVALIEKRNSSNSRAEGIMQAEIGGG